MTAAQVEGTEQTGIAAVCTVPAGLADQFHR
jgi:hypothetical protein